MERFLNAVKQTYESASLSTLILLELFLFAVCLHWCLPQRHRQARTIKLATSTDHVWTILLDIHRYPLWRSHVVSVQPLLGNQHLEHVARTRQHLEHKQQNHQANNPAFFNTTRVRAIDMNRVNDTTLIRIDRATRISSCTPPPSPPAEEEETCTHISNDGNKTVPSAPLQQQQQQQQQLKFPKSSFEREWEIHVRPSDDGTITLLTLVETVRSEGYLARWLGPIFGGFHRVSQRFLLDLVREVDRQQKQRVLHDQTLCESPVSLQQNPQKTHVVNEVYSTVAA